VANAMAASPLRVSCRVPWRFLCGGHIAVLLTRVETPN
jgi:hypothetical protein